MEHQAEAAGAGWRAVCVCGTGRRTFSRFVVTMTATAEASLVKLYIDMLYAKAAKDPTKMIPQPIAGFSLM